MDARKWSVCTKRYYYTIMIYECVCVRVKFHKEVVLSLRIDYKINGLFKNFD